MPKRKNEAMEADDASEDALLLEKQNKKLIAQLSSALTQNNPNIKLKDFTAPFWWTLVSRGRWHAWPLA